jgi:HlyD family secretion protein
MQIIPQDDDLVIEARLSPADIDSVYVGQRAYVRFPAFNQKTTPELPAKVIRVGADVSREQTQAGALPYYVVRVALEDGALAQAGGLKLVAGMPVEVHFNTGDRTILSYLLKPLTDQFAKALKER